MTEATTKKKRICLIYTGGTIGMERHNERGKIVLRPAREPERFLERLGAAEFAKTLADIDFVAPFDEGLDSTNIVPANWTAMAHAVYERMDAYDGFVVAHGTDTLHFTASALAFAFGSHLNKPVVLTGAQTTPDVSHGDARVNILRAIMVACQPVAEVVVAFGEYIFRGCRVQKKDERRFDAFESPAAFPLGYITEEIVLSDFAERSVEAASPLEFRPDFADGIVQISLIPGLRPYSLMPILHAPDVRGVVLQSFGAGNVPDQGEYSFVNFISTATQLNKPVVIASQFPANSTLDSLYEPGVKAVDAGAIPTGNMTNAAATAKFRWALHQVDARIKTDASLDERDRHRLLSAMMTEIFVNEMNTTHSSEPDSAGEIA